MNQLRRGAAVAGCLLALGCAPALAHKGSDAYLDVQELATPAAAAAQKTAIRDLRFTLAVALKDLDLLLPLDANADGKVTWGEVRAATPMVNALASEAVQLDGPGLAPAAPGTAPACHLDWQFDGLDRRGDGTYMRLVAATRCPSGQPLALRYTLLRDQDANHRLLVAGRVDGRDLLTTASPLQKDSLVLAAAHSGAGQTDATTTPAPAPTGRWGALRDYFALGAHHLLEGYDHLAFLLALVLPLRLVLSGPGAAATSARQRAGATRGTWLALLRTVTAFTVGHSITLMLATFGWTQASPSWVEPVIALSIAVTAALNLRPIGWIRTDVLALLFGMVHGFGFAGLLQEAAAPSGLLPWALTGFNLGVEAGQLMAVGGWVLLSQALVRRAWYGRVVVRGGSVALILLAAWWFAQRVSG